MKTFQIITLFALVAASMAFSPQQAGKFLPSWIRSVGSDVTRHIRRDDRKNAGWELCLVQFTDLSEVDWRHTRGQIDSIINRCSLFGVPVEVHRFLTSRCFICVPTQSPRPSLVEPLPSLSPPSLPLLSPWTPLSTPFLPSIFPFRFSSVLTWPYFSEPSFRSCSLSTFTSRPRPERLVPKMPWMEMNSKFGGV